MAIGRPLNLTPNVATKNISVTATSGQTQFTVAGGYTINQLNVYRNGIRLAQGSDFTASDGSGVTLLDDCALNDIVAFQVFDNFAVADAINSYTGGQTLNASFTITGDTTIAGVNTFTSGGILANQANITGIATIGTGVTVYGSTGIVSATAFYGDGANLTNVGMDTSNVVSVATTTGLLNVTTSGTLASATVTNDITVGGALTVTGNMTVEGTQTIINTDSLEVADTTIGIASTSTKLNDTQLNGAGVVLYGSVSDKTLTWNSTGSRMQFNTNMGVTGNTNVSGIATFNNVNVSGASTFATVNVSGAATVGLLTATNAHVSGAITATAYYGDGANLTGVSAGLVIENAGSAVGSAITNINFVGATVTGSGAGSTVTIAAAGLTTTAYSAAANSVVNLGLSTAQHHEVTLVAGVTTISCHGGSFGDSHSVVLIQPSSGITTVGFSTYFLWPSGSAPNLGRAAASSEIDLVSFVVKQVAVGATQLLASAGIDYQ